MRLWSLHPSFLDRQGLVALWREALLAQKVLQGQTKGYRFHPQLRRFQERRAPLTAISAYLWAIHDEATRRSYSFKSEKIVRNRRALTMAVTRQQLAFEWEHLQTKLRQRDPERHRKLAHITEVTAHPLFIIVEGDVEPWEVRAAPKKNSLVADDNLTRFRAGKLKHGSS
jgi:hypothetical protein